MDKKSGYLSRSFSYIFLVNNKSLAKRYPENANESGNAIYPNTENELYIASYPIGRNESMSYLKTI